MNQHTITHPDCPGAMQSHPTGNDNVSSRPARALTKLVLIFGLLSIAVAFAFAILADTYNYPHAWVSAHFATIGRSYLENGFLSLGFVPVQNNLPLTATPDYYLNWPPLYGMVVGVVLGFFGDTEITHHLFATTLNVGSAALVFAIIRSKGSLAAAAFGFVAFLCAPMIGRYGFMGSQLHLAIFFLLASLFAFLKATDTDETGRRPYAILGTVAFCLAVLSSWEPVLAAPALVITGLVARNRPAVILGLIYGCAGTATILGIFALYWTEVAYFGDAILERVSLRMGLAAGYETGASEIFSSPHFLQEKAEQTGLIGWQQLIAIFLTRLVLLGPMGMIGLVATIAFALKISAGQMRSALVPITAFLSIFVLWALFLPNHMIIHQYQGLLLVPAAALAFGVLAAEAPRLLSRFRADFNTPRRQLVLTGVILCVALMARVLEGTILLGADRSVENAQIEFSRSIAKVVPPSSIVAFPDRSMVPVYYAKRHIIRSVKDEAILAENRSSIEALCDHCGIYLAIPDDALDLFPDIAANHPAALSTQGGLIVTLRPGTSENSSAPQEPSRVAVSDAN